MFLYIFEHFTATHRIPLTSPALELDSITDFHRVEPWFTTSNLFNHLRTLYAQ
ncbi:MAG: hypothetical protein MRERC_9c032 [Mycoplasmataceae bacterium RC_NB112A]|nr:MAG: hypothetical protein MRERC_9c032 [Mycoplasmataceae bacterium RC_NB112A]